MNLEDSGTDKEGEKKKQNYLHRTGNRMSDRSLEKEFLGVTLKFYILKIREPTSKRLLEIVTTQRAASGTESL